jgi:hypothetical protein
LVTKRTESSWFTDDRALPAPRVTGKSGEAVSPKTHVLPLESHSQCRGPIFMGAPDVGTVDNVHRRWVERLRPTRKRPGRSSGEGNC